MKEKKPFDLMEYFSAIRIFIAILLSLLIVFIIIFFVSDDPLFAISKLILGPLQSKRSLFNVVERAMPLIFTGLALNISLRSGIFNIGVDGSFYMGAVVATAIAIRVQLPNIVHQTVLILAAGLVGGCINTLPKLIGGFTKINPTVLSIMFNSIFYYVGLSIVSTYLLEKGGSWGSYYFLDTARLGNLIKGTSMHWGFVIMLAVIVLVVLLMEHTSFGYKVRVSGINPHFARSAGIKVGSVVTGAQFLGGFVGGMGGAVEMVGMYKRFQWQGQVAYVWDGLLVHMLANQNPKYIPLTALFIAYLRIGAEIMSRVTDIDPEVVTFLQGIVILLVASERFLYGIKKRHDQKKSLEQAETSAVTEGAK
ncbi:MAG TPA: ABC transporter permease [Feifaniaceae bacterium]|nr:ABC transporter permease [Feifaniaceae bacterium]